MTDDLAETLRSIVKRHQTTPKPGAHSMEDETLVKASYEIDALRARVAELEARSSVLDAAIKWRFIDTAPWSEPDEFGDRWLGRCLLGKNRSYGFEAWVGQCDAGNIWLGRDGDGACFETDAPTHWASLPAPPDLQAISASRTGEDDA